VRSDLHSVRVLPVDDQELLRRGVAQVLERDTEIRAVGEAGEVSAALRRAPAARPDVAVVAPGCPIEGMPACASNCRLSFPGCAAWSWASP
jgi:DNA-binding NarL/FixJ family response regulator